MLGRIWISIWTSNLLSLYWKRTNKWGVLAGMIVGALVVITWVQIPSLKATMYEMVPGFFCSLLTVIVVSLLTKEPVKAVHREFNEMEAVLEEERNDLQKSKR